VALLQLAANANNKAAIAREGHEVVLAALQEHPRHASVQMHGRALLMILDEIEQTRKTAAEEERKRTVAENAEKMRKLEANATRRQQQEQHAQERARRQAPEEHAREEHALRTLAAMGSTDTKRNTALLETLHYNVDQVIDILQHTATHCNTFVPCGHRCVHFTCAGKFRLRSANVCCNPQMYRLAMCVHTHAQIKK